MIRLKLFLLFISLLMVYCVKAQNEILKVASTLKKSEGSVTVFYPSGTEKQAKWIQTLIEKATDYYQKQIGINIPVSVALLGPAEYEQYTKELWGKSNPYNRFLPRVQVGPPIVIILPSAPGSAIDSLIKKAISGEATILKLNFLPEEISFRFTALVGLHELGHLYMNELEITQPISWFQELMANFIADAFLTSNAGSDAQLWQLVNKAFVSNLKATNTTISGIEMGDQENYVWWQGNLTLQAHEVFKNQGLTFLQELRKLNNVKIFSDDISFLIALDQIAPGFEYWAEKRGHISKEDKLRMQTIKSKIITETKNALSLNMPYPFTRSFSTQWDIGKDSLSQIIMKFLKDFEDNSFTQEDIFAEYMELSLPAATGSYEKSEAITKLMEARARLNNPKIRLHSVIPLRSVDRNSDWVLVNGSIRDSLANGTLEKIDFHQQYMFNKEGKIEDIKQYVFLATSGKQ